MTLMGGRPLRAVLTAAVLALGVVLGGAATAQAATEDPLADKHEGNATTCEQAGLSGSVLAAGDYTYARGKDNADQFVDILSVSSGATVTGIVVKGGPNYNVYVPGENGLPADPPWTDLRSPLVGNGNIPTISHWFVCGTKETETTTTAPTSASTTTTTSGAPGTSASESSPASSGASGTSGSVPGSSAESSSSVAGVVGTSAPSPSATAPANASKLAYTGFDAGWLVGLGAVLVLGGAALVFLMRARRRKA